MWIINFLHDPSCNVEEIMCQVWLRYLCEKFYRRSVWFYIFIKILFKTEVSVFTTKIIYH